MIIRSDVHTHTSFSDGINTPEEMIKRAVELGMQTIGISDHSPLKWENDFAIPEEKLGAYINEIENLKDKYSGKISVLLGIEMDSLSENDIKPFDYIIGSVHSFCVDGKMYDVDDTEGKLIWILENLFARDPLSLAEGFFKETVRMAKELKPQILGHFDLFTKYDEDAIMFPRTKEYIDYALDAVNACKDHVGAFEINTGAISRGYRKTAYPADFIIKHLKEKNIPIVLSSDGHRADSIKYCFDESVERLRGLGIEHIYEYHKDGFHKISLI